MAAQESSGELPLAPLLPLLATALPSHLHATVDGGDRCDSVMLVGAQQAAETTDELLVFLAKEAERVSVVHADGGLRVSREPQSIDHPCQGNVRRGAAAVYPLTTYGTAQLGVQVLGQGVQAVFAVGMTTL